MFPHVLVVWPLRLEFLATFAPHFARPRLLIASRLHGGAISGKLVMVSLLRDVTWWWSWRVVSQYGITHIYMSPVPGPPHPPLPPQWYPPPLLTPPTPPKPSICMLFAHIHTHIYSPFHPSNLASLRYLQHLRATTTPPTPPKPSICMYLHVICTYTYTYTHIYSPFHPSNLASLRYLQHLRATTSSTELLYLYISIITFFRTAYSVPRTWFTTYLLPMDYAKLTYANLDICTVEKQYMTWHLLSNMCSIEGQDWSACAP